MNLPPPPEPDKIRASDADRDAVAARLREALAEGRLTAEEHSERLDVVYGAKTMGELVPVTHDLPASASEPSRAPQSFASPRPVYGRGRIGGQPTGHSAYTLMGAATRGGSWTLPPAFTAVAVMGAVELDLREALFAQREVTIYASTLMGAVEITVPDDIEVRVSGLGVMGSYGEEGLPASVIEPGAPIVHVKGIALMGAVNVVRKARKHQVKSERAKREIDGGE